MITNHIPIPLNEYFVDENGFQNCDFHNQYFHLSLICGLNNLTDFSDFYIFDLKKVFISSVI